ncbi:MAG: hypothetical protein NC214_08470 [Candidatus Amulumruptor caecigallinarius]|nr:hypothetical protein [Candidatus Amulumruptor caecigallinarius]MCM1454318.1 hypothetical protein [bacterium]
MAIAFALFLTFIIVYLAVHGCPESLSATYYDMHCGWILPVALGVSSALTVAPMFSITPDHWRFLVFLFIMGMMFVAASPAFRDGLEKPVHYGAAIVMTAASLAWFAVMKIIPIAAIAFAVAATFCRKSWVYLCEMGLFLSIYISLFRLMM